MNGLVSDSVTSVLAFEWLIVGREGSFRIYAVKR